MFKRYLENRVIKDQWGYKCLQCNFETFNTSNHIIEPHINCKEHQDKLKLAKRDLNYEADILEHLSEVTSKKFVENYFSFNPNDPHSLKCHLCDVKMFRLPNAFEHINGRYHVTKIKQRIDLGAKLSNSVKQYDPSQDLSLMTLSNKDEVKVKKPCFRYLRICNICPGHDFEDSETFRCHVMIHVLSAMSLSKPADIIKCTDTQNNLIIKCILCNNFIPNGEDLSKHVKTSKHKMLLQHFECYIRKVPQCVQEEAKTVLDSQESINIKHYLTNHIGKVIHCQVCNKRLNNNALDQHNKSANHIIKLKSHGSTVEVNKINLPLVEQNMYCFICQSACLDLDSLLRHYNLCDHKYKMYCLNEIIKNPVLSFMNGKQLVHCSLCKMTTQFFLSTMDHLFGKKHQLALNEKNESVNSQLSNGTSGIKKSTAVTEIHVSAVNKVVPPPTKSTTVQVPQQSGPSSTSSTTTDTRTLNDMLNNLVKFESKMFDPRRNIAAVANLRSPQASPGGQSKLNSFCASVLNWGKTYIKFCIEPGPYNIYNLDPDQIRLLKLGASLTFQKNSMQMCLPCGKEIPIDKNYIYEHLQDSSHIYNIRSLEANDREFIDFPDQFSDLRLARDFIVELDAQRLQCYACNVEFNNDNADISLHTETSKHSKNTKAWSESSKQLSNEFSNIFENIWYYAQVFNCEICKEKCEFEIDFVIHLMKSNHSRKVKEMENRRVMTKFDFCPVCVTFWYGKEECHRLHCEATYHRRFANNGDFVVPKMSDMTKDLLEKVDMKSINLENESNKVELEKQSELELLKSVEDAVRPIYPMARAYTFGSRLSNLGFPDSDVDVFLDCQDQYNKISDKASDQKIIMSVKNYFENLPDVWIIDEILLPTRVPILKLRHIPTSLKCDISFTNGLSVEKSTIVGDYNNAYRECRLLTLYLKKWLTTCKLAGSECITTFATSWLVIFYLQSKGILPSVHDLIILKNESKIVDGWECGFARNIPVTRSALNFKDLLKGFFSYYAKYDFRSLVVCPYLGISLKKSAFASPESLPTEYNLYKSRLRKDVSLVFRFDSPMCVQDPVDLSQNMTKAVKKLQLRCFKQYCTDSYQLIQRT